MSKILDFLALLPSAKQTGDRWRALCPAHDDQTPSFTVQEGEDGRILLHCHAGCSVDAICRSLNLEVSHLFTEKWPKGKKPMSNLTPQKTTRKTFPNLESAITAAESATQCQNTGVWVYHDDEGNERLHVVRLEAGEKKTYRPICRTADGFVLGDPNGPLPLYRLPEVLAAKRIYVCEGEKAADAARSIGLTATTSAHGAKSPKKTDWSPLAGKEVVILPDHDQPGEDYAEAVAEILSELKPPARVRIVRLPGLSEHGDLVDFLDAREGAEPDDLKEAIEKLAAATAERVGLNQPKLELLWQPFPFDVLPSPLADFTWHCSRALGCDPSYIALNLLVACAGAIGTTRVIELKKGWREPAILWGVAVGESGTMKSPAFRLALEPLQGWQAAAMAQYRTETARYIEACDEYERAKKKYEKAKAAQDADDPNQPFLAQPIEPKRPNCQRIIVSDTTIEALAPILLENPAGVLLARDELAGWTGSFDRYASSGKSDAAHWLSIHSGSALTFDRKTGFPRTVFVPRPAVSICGGIQPRILKKIFTEEHRASGLAARLLLVWPPRVAKRWNEHEISETQVLAMNNLFLGLLQISRNDDPFSDTTPIPIPLSLSAKALFVDFYNEHAVEQVDLNEDLSAVWSKLEGYAARIALIVHCVRVVANHAQLVDPHLIDAQSMESGIILAKWFAHEAKRVYAMLEETEGEEENRKLVEWITRRGGRATVRETQQGNRRFSTVDEARQALEQLVEHGFGQWEKLANSAKPGRRPECFVLGTKA